MNVEPWFIRDASVELLLDPQPPPAPRAACNGCHEFRKNITPGGTYTFEPVLIEPVTKHNCLNPPNCVCPECGYNSNKYYEDLMEDRRQAKLLELRIALNDTQGELRYMEAEGYSRNQIEALLDRVKDLQAQLDMADL